MWTVQEGMTNYQPKKKYLSQLRHHNHQDVSQQHMLMDGVQEDDSLQLQQQQHLEQQDNLQQQQIIQQHLQQLSYNQANVDNNNNTTTTTQISGIQKITDEQSTKISEVSVISSSTNHPSSPASHISSSTSHASPSATHLSSPSTPFTMINITDPSYNKDITRKPQQSYNNSNANNSYLHCSNLPRLVNSVNFNKFQDSYLWSQQQHQQIFNRTPQQQQYQLCENNNNQLPTLQVLDTSSIHSPHQSFIHTIHSSHPHNTISPCSTSDELSVLNIKEELHNNNNNVLEDNKFCLNDNLQHQQVSPQYYNTNNNKSQGNLQETSNKKASSINLKDSITSNNQTQQQLLQQLKPLLTSSGRNKGSGKPIEPKHLCQVCGDLAAGFHCGAYVCEACKVGGGLCGVDGS